MSAARTDFGKFFAGQALSNFGSSFTLFAIPLLVYQLTGSATNLAISSAAEGLPYLLFGLLAGAWVDRVDRRRMMIVVELLRAATIASIPFLATFGALPLWWIYGAGFVTTTLAILFNAGEFAAIPSLVTSDDLIAANGRIQASYSFATVAGPPVAGLLATVTPIVDVLYFDALTFLFSALTLVWIKASFNAGPRSAATSLRAEIAEGLRYVWRHPVLRNISLMMALVNFVATTVFVQLVLFAKRELHASDFQYGLVVGSQSIGVIALSLLAGRLRRRWPFGVVALGALALSGLLTVGLAFTGALWVAVPLVAAIAGLGTLFNINTGSLRQTIVPNHLLGRIMSIASVVAWSMNPLGALLGGALVTRFGVRPIYLLAGTLTSTIALAFAFSPLGHAEDYLPETGRLAPRDDAVVEPAPARDLARADE